MTAPIGFREVRNLSSDCCNFPFLNPILWVWFPLWLHHSGLCLRLNGGPCHRFTLALAVCWSWVVSLFRPGVLIWLDCFSVVGFGHPNGLGCGPFYGVGSVVVHLLLIVATIVVLLLFLWRGSLSLALILLCSA